MRPSGNDGYGTLANHGVQVPRPERSNLTDLGKSITGSAEESHRYRGRSTSRREAPSEYIGQRAQPRVIQMRQEDEATLSAARSTSVKWSPRLALALLGLIGLILGGRVSGGFPPPVDAPFGVEATHASFARQLAGISTGRPDGDLQAIASPWLGAAPVDPLAGLPIYTWLVAMLSPLMNIELSGRIVSIVLGTLAGICLFALVYRTAGARAAVYASLLYAVAPSSILIGRHFSQAALLLFLQAITLLLLVRWRDTATDAKRNGSRFAFALVLGVGFLYGLVDAGAIFLVLPALLLMTSLPALGTAQVGRTSAQRLLTARATFLGSLNRGRFAAYLSSLLLGTVAWLVYRAGSMTGLSVAGGDTFSLGTAIMSLFSASTYVQVVGGLVGTVSGMLGLLLLGAGLMVGARNHYRYIYHVWLGAATLHIIFDASRLPHYDDALLPLVLPACALVGIGAAWAASLPARLWLALTERRRLSDDEYAVSPHTAWLLDLPEERFAGWPTPRPQAQLALGKNLAERSREAGRKARRASLVLAGHAAITICFGTIMFGNLDKVFADRSLSPASTGLIKAGAEINALTKVGSKLIIAGPSAPELFYTSDRTGWALGSNDYSLSGVQALQRSGASYLVSTDQDWLGSQPEYFGLLSNFSVARLTREYILFDLNTKPSANDRLYFLESGHTLGGDFRRFWESNGGVQKLGYPISEVYQDLNPVDGQTRTVQYFERAVLESHPEKAGTPDSVMLAAVGRWVTRDRGFPRAAPFESTADNVYFPETGHSLKQAFLRFWLKEGGLTQYGYPISEELPEISAADGKVYTVQYFERARFEWHPTDAGTAKEVQLGLVGKQALEMRK